MGGRPFRTGAQPAARNHGDGPTKPAVNEATTAKKAAGDKSLMEAAAETIAPDYEVGATAGAPMDPDQEGDGQRKAYKDRIPWPDAKPASVSRKPFKL